MDDLAYTFDPTISASYPELIPESAVAKTPVTTNANRTRPKLGSPLEEITVPKKNLKSCLKSHREKRASSKTTTKR